MIAVLKELWIRISLISYSVLKDLSKRRRQKNGILSGQFIGSAKIIRPMSVPVDLHDMSHGLSEDFQISQQLSLLPVVGTLARKGQTGSK